MASLSKSFSLFVSLCLLGGTATLSLADESPDKGKLVGKAVIEKADINLDGKDDVWVHFQESEDPNKAGYILRKLTRKEADLNFDGKVDIVRIYDAKEQLQEETVDLDFDGHKDSITRYENSQVKVRDFFQPNRETIFIHKAYVNGKLAEVRRDEDTNGVYDYCEVWYDGVKLLRVGKDLNGDGECDFWEQPK